MRKILFLDRDGVLIREKPETYQVDTLEDLVLMPGLIRHLYQIQSALGFELVMVTNQDGLGTDAYPEPAFRKVQDKLLEILRQEGIYFHAVHVDRSFEEEGLPTRKPGIGMLTGYLDGSCDLANSFVVGDRWSDLALARNLGTRAIGLRGLFPFGEWESGADLIADSWEDIARYLLYPNRVVTLDRRTRETEVSVRLDLDGEGHSDIRTGLGFFDHMLQQVAVHGQLDLTVQVRGDLHVDEHHTVEDTALTLGEAFRQALGDKRGISRYGFCLPMDDCLAQVALDFGGRPWCVWEADFRRERIGDCPTELFFHFFKSFGDAAACNLHVQASGTNEHHKIEAIFKAFARAVRMAVRREGYALPSSKGVL